MKNVNTDMTEDNGFVHLSMALHLIKTLLSQDEVSDEVHPKIKWTWTFGL